jgi:hypothetical protein
MPTEHEVKNIKKLLAEGNTQRVVGEMFNLSRSYISDIACGRSFGDVGLTIEADPDHKLRAEVLHLKEERNLLRRELKTATRNIGLFDAVVDEVRAKPMKALPSARAKYQKGKIIEESLVIHLSDGHHDQVVSPEDTGGLEEYNFDISCCRAEKYIDTTLKWTQETLQQFRFPSVTVLAYGDHTSGELHGHVPRSHFKNQLQNCLAIGKLHALMLRDLAPYFEQVNVVYVSGNHGRRSTKKDYNGPCDNYDYLIAKIAEMQCSEIENINFSIPNAFSVNVDICGIGFNIAHGDDVRSAMGVPWYGLERRRHRLIALNTLQSGPPVRFFCGGHFHRPGTTAELNGEMIINGAWLGSDSYAFNAFSGYTEPTQLIHGVNEKGITWRLPVRMKCEYEARGPKRYRVEP